MIPTRFSKSHTGRPFRIWRYLIPASLLGATFILPVTDFLLPETFLSFFVTRLTSSPWNPSPSLSPPHLLLYWIPILSLPPFISTVSWVLFPCPFSFLRHSCHLPSAFPFSGMIICIGIQNSALGNTTLTDTLDLLSKTDQILWFFCLQPVMITLTSPHTRARSCLARTCYLSISCHTAALQPIKCWRPLSGWAFLLTLALLTSLLCLRCPLHTPILPGL